MKKKSREDYVPKYPTVEKMKVGDIVEIKRFLWKSRRGEVIHVFDPQKWSGYQSDNESGFTIRFPGGSVLLEPNPFNVSRVRLLERVYCKR